jgi:hypothetical protein
MNAPRRPNRFELSGYEDVELTYDTTSIAGQPQLHYRHGDHDVSRSGEEIRSLETEIGTLVTAEVDSVPDSHTLTVSVLLPAINLGEGDADFETSAIETTSKTSIGGPNLVTGALETYEFLPLSGKASLVSF